MRRPGRPQFGVRHRRRLVPPLAGDVAGHHWPLARHEIDAAAAEVRHLLSARLQSTAVMAAVISTGCPLCRWHGHSSRLRSTQDCRAVAPVRVPARLCPVARSSTASGRNTTVASAAEPVSRAVATAAPTSTVLLVVPTPPRPAAVHPASAPASPSPANGSGRCAVAAPAAPNPVPHAGQSRQEQHQAHAGFRGCAYRAPRDNPCGSSWPYQYQSSPMPYAGYHSRRFSADVPRRVLPQCLRRLVPAHRPDIERRVGCSLSRLLTALASLGFATSEQ